MKLLRDYDPSWELVRKAVSLSYESCTAEELYAACNCGKAEVWRETSGAFTLVLLVERGEVWVVALFGKGADALLDELAEWLQSYAKEKRCKTVALMGRKGWIRRLKSLGYEFQAVILKCEVN